MVKVVRGGNVFLENSVLFLTLDTRRQRPGHLLYQDAKLSGC